MYTPASELKPIGENPVFRKDFSRSFATGFDNTGKNDWIQTRIYGCIVNNWLLVMEVSIPEGVLGMCSMLEDSFGNGKTLTKVSGNPFGSGLVVRIFNASQLPVIGFCAKYIPINKRRDDVNRPVRSSAPCMAVIEEWLFQCSLSPRLPGSAGGEQHKRCGGRLVKADLWTPPQ